MKHTLLLALPVLLSLGCASSPAPTDRHPSSFTPTNPAQLCQNLSRMEIHSHRGAFDRPENMMTAFLRAAEIGADVIEMDLQITKDDQVVVAHDAYLKDECVFASTGQAPSQRQFYRYLTLAQVKAFDCGSKVKSGQPAPGEKISTLTEVLNTTRNTRTLRGRDLGYNIEIKYNPTQPQYYPSREVYIGLLLKTLDEAKIENRRLLVQSFDVEILKVLKQRRPDLRVSPLLPDAKDGILIAQSLKTDLITPHLSQVNPAMLAKFHEAGVQVIPWTANRPDEALELIRWGADGAITDQPEIFVLARQMCGQ